MRAPSAPGPTARPGAGHRRLAAVTIPPARVEQSRRLAHVIVTEPFQRRTWSEIGFFLCSGALTAAGMAFVAVTMATGVFLAVTFVGLVIIAGSVRGARGIGTWHRDLARRFLGEDIADPPPFAPLPGLLGWLQAALKDRAGWRAMAYAVTKVPLVLLTVWLALSIWVQGLLWIAVPVLHGGGPGPGVGVGVGVVRNFVGPARVGGGIPDVFRSLVTGLLGVLLIFAAPWAMRLMIEIDRRLMRVLLGPDALTARVRSLE